MIFLLISDEDEMDLFEDPSDHEKEENVMYGDFFQSDTTDVDGPENQDKDDEDEEEEEEEDEGESDDGANIESEKTRTQESSGPKRDLFDNMDEDDASEQVCNFSLLLDFRKMLDEIRLDFDLFLPWSDSGKRGGTEPDLIVFSIFTHKTIKKWKTLFLVRKIPNICVDLLIVYRYFSKLPYPEGQNWTNLQIYLSAS